MDFSASFTIGQKEVSAFTRRMQWLQKQRAFFIVSAVGLLCGNFVLRFFQASPGFWLQVLCSLLGGALAFGLSYGSMRFGVAKSCNSEYAAGRRWVYTQTIRITPLGVSCVTDGGEESRVDFDALTVEECAEAFYLFLSKDSAWILPKAQLAHPQEDAAKIREIFTTMSEPARLNLRRG